MNREIRRSIIEMALKNGSSSASPVKSLSRRELETYQLLGCGMATPAIAEQMHLSLKRVQAYSARIKKKLDLPNHFHLLRSATLWEKIALTRCSIFAFSSHLFTIHRLTPFLRPYGACRYQ